MTTNSADEKTYEKIEKALEKVYGGIDLQANRYIRDLETFIEDLRHKSLFFSEPSKDLKVLLDRLSKDLCRKIPKGMEWFRARRHQATLSPPIAPYGVHEIGAPPKTLVSTGRLNSEGISFLYLASNFRLAQLEVRSIRGAWSTIGTFKAAREQTVFDTSHIPENYSSEEMEFIIYLDGKMALPSEGKAIETRFTRWMAEYLLHKQKIENFIYSCSIAPSYRINDRNICSFVPDAWDVTGNHLVQFEGIIYAP